MAVTHSLSTGQIVMCDFSTGFRKPEMVKKRPVIVLTPTSAGLVTVVALSTIEPNPITAVHHKMDPVSLPRTRYFFGKTNWLKGDMIYRVSHDRLNLIRLDQRDSDGKRAYFLSRLNNVQMKLVTSCVLHGLNLGALVQHL